MDLEQLGKQVDELLAKETKETMTEWLYKRRQNVNASDSNYAISDVIPRLSRLRERYLEEFGNTKIKDFKPMFQNYKSIQERETLHFIEYCQGRI